jgi:AraC-like DNA-binding protein
VAEVAAATGFAESSSFCRAFKRWTGRSPREDGGTRGGGAP